jgi:hypothetical protein
MFFLSGWGYGIPSLLLQSLQYMGGFNNRTNSGILLQGIFRKPLYLATNAFFGATHEKYSPQFLHTKPETRKFTSFFSMISVQELRALWKINMEFPPGLSSQNFPKLEFTDIFQIGDGFCLYMILVSINQTTAVPVFCDNFHIILPFFRQEHACMRVFSISRILQKRELPV